MPSGAYRSLSFRRIYCKLLSGRGFARPHPKNPSSFTHQVFTTTVFFMKTTIPSNRARLCMNTTAKDYYHHHHLCRGYPRGDARQLPHHQHGGTNAVAQQEDIADKATNTEIWLNQQMKILRPPPIPLS
jgi:hypothetical protein